MLTPRSVKERFDEAMECMMTMTTLKVECARSPTLLSLVSFARFLL